MNSVPCVLHRADAAPLLPQAAEMLAWTLSNGRVRVLHPHPARDPGFMPTEEVMTAAREASFRVGEDESADRIVQAFESWKAHMMVTPTLEEVGGDVAALVADAARMAAIVVLAASPGHVLESAALEPQHVLEATRRPVLAVPDTPLSDPGERIALPCDGDLDLAWLPAEATAILRNAREIHLLVRCDATDGRARQEKAMEALAARGARVDAHVMTPGEGRLGHALVDRALCCDCDMLIMEAHDRSWLRAALVGRNSWTLASSTLPVLLHA